MPRKLSIGFLSPHNPFDRSAFSGVAFYMHRALAGRPDVDVRILGNHRPVSRIGRFLRFGKPRQMISVEGMDVSGLDWVVALTATQLAERLVASTSARVVHVTDATPSFLREYYGKNVPYEADEVEARLVRNGALTIFSSEYMARRAAAEFGPDIEDRIASVPFGMNFDTAPARMPDKPPLTRLKLLWIGGQWERKGGAIALGALDSLRASGMEAELWMVGNVPDGAEEHSGAVRMGYLSKARRDQADKLRRLYSEAHVFVLPTRADCTPMVVAEANAHGTPVLITDTGGVPSLMAEGRNGRMLPMEAGPEDWAAAIRDITADPAAHAELCRTSFEHARTRLTWDAWANDVVELLRERSDTQAYPLR